MNFPVRWKPTLIWSNRRLSAAVILVLAFSMFLPLSVHSAESTSLEVKKILEKPERKSDSGTIKVLMEITSGPHAGEKFRYRHQLWGNSSYDPKFSIGKTFVGTITWSNGNVERLELGQSRKDYTLIGIFLMLTLMLFLLAGLEGLAGLFCSLITLGAVLYGFFPLAISATNVTLAGILLCLFTIILTVPLILKFSRPAIPAVISLVTTTLFLFIFSRWALDYLKLDPAMARHSRLILTHLNRLSIHGTDALFAILVSGIVLGTLGAMMDVSVVVCSTIHEITRDTDSFSFKEAFLSGMNVGREILSTMVNTLLFAYASVLLPVLIGFQIFDLSWIRFFNYPFIGIEILRICVGLLGLSTIIPFSAFLGAFWSQ